MIIKQIRDCFYPFWQLSGGPEPFPAAGYTGQIGVSFQRKGVNNAPKNFFNRLTLVKISLKTAVKGFFAGIDPAQSTM
jgi:hypothetical protein